MIYHAYIIHFIPLYSLYIPGLYIYHTRLYIHALYNPIIPCLFTSFFLFPDMYNPFPLIMIYYSFLLLLLFPLPLLYIPMGSPVYIYIIPPSLYPLSLHYTHIVNPCIYTFLVRVRKWKLTNRLKYWNTEKN